jgi:hypothetical protein
MASNVPGCDAVTTQLKAWHRHDQTSQCLATIPGDGPIRDVSFALKVADARAFRSGRHFAARIGMTPLENSTAGKPRLARSAARAMRTCGGCSCSAPPRSSSRPNRAAPRNGSWDCWRRSIRWFPSDCLGDDRRVAMSRGRRAVDRGIPLHRPKKDGLGELLPLRGLKLVQENRYTVGARTASAVGRSSAASGKFSLTNLRDCRTRHAADNHAADDIDQNRRINLLALAAATDPAFGRDAMEPRISKCWRSWPFPCQPASSAALKASHKTPT